jgi:hypothetical protein
MDATSQRRSSTDVREPSVSAEAAAEILDATGVEWALIGGLAALRYRRTPRLTVDADFLATYVPGLAEAFRDAGYEVTESAQPGEPPHLLAVRGKGDVIDVLLAVVEYQHVALERAVDRVLTAEDVIVHKLIAWRPRDRNDIASILEVVTDLDEAYIELWAAEWDVADRWEQARRSR